MTVFLVQGKTILMSLPFDIFQNRRDIVKLGLLGCLLNYSIMVILECA